MIFNTIIKFYMCIRMIQSLFQVFQGLLRSNAEYQKSKESMLRLWCNEVFRVFNDKLIDTK